MFIELGNKPKYIGRKVRNTNDLSKREGWIGEIVDQDSTHILVKYNYRERNCRGWWEYTLQTYMKGRKQRLQLLSKSHG